MSKVPLPLHLQQYVAGTDSLIRWVNPTYWSILSQTDVAPPTRRFLGIIHPVDRPASVAALEKVAGGQSEVGLENRYLPQDGPHLWIPQMTTPTSMKGTLHIVGRDTTERRGVEETLKERTRLAELAAEVGCVLNRDICLREMLCLCAESLVQHLDAAFARIWTLAPEGDVLHLQASAGMYTHIDGPHGRVPVGTLKIGLIAQERRPHLTNSVVGDPRVGDQRWAAREGMVAFAGYPLLIDDYLVGVMALFARHSLSDYALQAMATVANSIALAIDRKRAEQALRESEQRFRSLSGCSPVGIFTTDISGRCSYANPRCLAIVGFSAEEALGEGWTRYLHPEDRERVLTEWSAAVRADRGFDSVYRFRTPQGGVRWVHGRSSPMRDDRGELVGHVGTIEDITGHKHAEEQLAYQATHDALTGLPNRVLFQQHLGRCIASGRAGETSFALVLLDLDRFKQINDTFGHHYGDAVLKELSPRLMDSVRDSDVVARLGGDEFGVLLSGADQARAALVAERILAVVERPFLVEDQPLDVGISIGIAMYPEHGSDAVTLMQRADVAMYAAKRTRSGRAIYTAGQANHTPRRMALSGELRRGIEDGQLLLHYQPKIDLGTMRAVGAEALVRWLHPREGLILPDEFIPLAEYTGLIRPLGLWALNTALLQCRVWHRMGLDLNVAVNLAPESLQDAKLVDEIGTLLESSDALPQWLTVEVTEGAVIEEPARAKRVLDCLHKMGVRIALDDFGTGYSSLTYLREMPVDEVKVDRGFVRDMASNRRDACIVKSVIDLGHNLGHRIVAEGVEDEAGLQLLTSWGCDLAQGYYFSRPLPPPGLPGLDGRIERETFRPRLGRYTNPQSRFPSRWKYLCLIHFALLLGWRRRHHVISFRKIRSSTVVKVRLLAA